MSATVTHLRPIQPPQDRDKNHSADLSENSADQQRGYRQLPYNLDVEMVVLGAVLRNNQALEAIDIELLPEYFYAAEHQRLMDQIRTVTSRGQIASPATLSHVADADPLLGEAGGGQYLFDLAANLANVVNIGQYAQELKDLHLKRRLIAIGEDAVNDAHDLSDLDSTAARQIEKVESRLFNLATTGDGERALTEIGEAATRALAQIADAKERSGKLVGVTTGLKDIDRQLGGLHPSDLIILAGRPGMGKTGLATNMAYSAARAYQEAVEKGAEVNDGAQVLFFSLEMSAEQLANRILSERTGIASDRLRRGAIERADLDSIGLEAARLADLPLVIDDTPALSISAMRQRARRQQRRQGLGMIVVDYLQLVAPPPGMRPENRVQEVSEITRGLKALARELKVPVLALSQLSRGVEQRPDNRPILSDLRDSGSIEQDADVVAFIYREEYYLKNRGEPPQKASESSEAYQKRLDQFERRRMKTRNIAEFLIEKQRHGPTGKVELYFDSALIRFGDLDRVH